MKKAVYCKTMGNLRNRIYVKLLKSEKDYLKWTSNPCYMRQSYLTMIYLQYVKAKLY